MNFQRSQFVEIGSTSVFGSPNLVLVISSPFSVYTLVYIVYMCGIGGRVIR